MKDVHLSLKIVATKDVVKNILVLRLQASQNEHDWFMKGIVTWIGCKESIV